jgi:hypothetical protein
MKYSLSWYQVNYTTAGRLVRANVVTEIEGHGTIGKDVELLAIPADAPISDVVVLEALGTELGDPDIQTVPVTRPVVVETPEGDSEKAPEAAPE